MFLLRRGDCGATGAVNVAEGDEFGWWLGRHEIGRAEPTRDSRSSASSASMVSCIDSEDGEDFALAQDFAARRDDGAEDGERTELGSLSGKGDLDAGSIERDSRGDDNRGSRRGGDDQTYCGGGEGGGSGVDGPYGSCYTPERLVRSQEYRILTPSPRFAATLGAAESSTPETSPLRAQHHRRRLGRLIDERRIGASHLEALLGSAAPEIRIPAASRKQPGRRERATCRRYSEPSSDPLTIANRESPVDSNTPDPISSRSSYEKLSDGVGEAPRSSREDTTGIRSNYWGSGTASDSPTPQRLCDELANASESFARIAEPPGRVAAINEVVSILEGLEKEPHRATALLVEDRFCDSCSGHDHVTRLALTIEPDGNVPPVLGDPETVVRQLRGKVERLRNANRDLCRDIFTLRRDFQCDEKKVNSLVSTTSTLRQEVNEVRYLDDLLSLLRGELEKISSRNWPFVLGHTEHHSEEINLVV